MNMISNRQDARNAKTKNGEMPGLFFPGDPGALAVWFILSGALKDAAK